mmetsp:Transcript_95399/g.298200  ORF Transcript_95399/g.298200 Transcript_95399/m.298200 type:complete len:147 (+) Transcript_95399:81-521(+)
MVAHPKTAMKGAKAVMKKATKGAKAVMKKATKGAKAVMKKSGAKATKVMKAMKATMSKIARGRMAFLLVYKGRKEKTVGGLQAKDIVKNKYGKLVSKKFMAKGKTAPWPKAISAARKALGLTGFVTINKGPEGKALYVKAKALMSG